MKYIIASDFHLKINESIDDFNRRMWVEEFLKAQIGKLDVLILNGDIFDFWMEWDNLIIKNFYKVLTLFSKLYDNGCKLIYITGNHDRWVGEFLSDEIGFDIYHDHYSFKYKNKRVYVSHGDKCSDNDLHYNLINSLMNSEILMKIANFTHPQLMIKIAELISRTDIDRIYTDNRKCDKLKEKAKTLCKVYDIVIFGHSHTPDKVIFNDSIYINTGDWINHRTYCQIENNKIKINKFNL